MRMFLGFALLVTAEWASDAAMKPDDVRGSMMCAIASDDGGQHRVGV